MVLRLHHWTCSIFTRPSSATSLYLYSSIPSFLTSKGPGLVIFTFSWVSSRHRSDLDTSIPLADHLHRRLRRILLHRLLLHRLLHRLLTTTNDRFCDSHTKKGGIGHQIGLYKVYVCVCVCGKGRSDTAHTAGCCLLFLANKRQKSGARACISFTYSRCLLRHCDRRPLLRPSTSPAPSFRTSSIVNPASTSRRLLTFHVRLIHAIAPTLLFESGSDSTDFHQTRPLHDAPEDRWTALVNVG